MTDTAPVLVPAETLSAVRALYDQGLYLQAYHVAEQAGPLRRWSGAAARVLAGRLAGNLGGARLAACHFILAWRHEPTHAEACWFYANSLADLHGPYKAWRFLQSQKELVHASREHESHWYSLHA